ncbi:cysteine--tRNA ligase [Candidatus Pacearchaeota archaeon CG10_big_fil_rev_8_21_14_0_10_31_9]|nr:MAG: cysteine--tRNA ligase [Candidatus Pacearchaeota archaeon CG1_02_32_21]PIN93676.1 MAG: cysteine--tRNA ligase [Candidatus Pacearchaeota archaeon CG10_big_fil_rev_8_21_14_0_10_31_9]
MPLKIYNTLTRKKQVFTPIKKSHVSIYSCGPTVYWYQHIGNLRSYIFSDVLKRILLFNGYNVRHVINITDVGHLTSDADEGEDKIEAAAKKEHKTAHQISEHYFSVFKNDLGKLNIILPDVWPKASEHIEEQIGLIEELEEKGYTYKTADGIYFNTSKFKKYGKMARLNIKGLQAGKRVSMGDKKNLTDFALWKFSDPPGVRQQEWDSPWGIGFPGWHIECSAMSMKYLGDKFDIHTGGEDHISVHHTNEIAQSEAVTGKPFVNYWMHGAFLTFKGEKISKSKGGLYTLSELENMGFNALDYRYFCLTTSYRKQLDFSIEKLKSAKNTYERLKNICQELKDDGSENKKYLEDFGKAVNDDINTVKAVQIIWKLLRDQKANGKLETVRKMDEVFALNLLIKEHIKIPKNIQSLIDEREQARKNKNWRLADELRDKISSYGYTLSDTTEGPVVKKT